MPHQVYGVGFRNLVLDLRQLTFIDSRAVHLLERWAGAATNDGFSFSVITGVESVHRVFELTGTADSLPFDGGPKRAGARGG